MSGIEIVLDCPLDKVCEEIRDGKLHRCRSWQMLKGKHPQSETEIEEWGCSLFQWLPILLTENAQTNRGQTQALESFRNEMVKGQQVFNGLIGAALQRKIGGDGG